jgi:N-hydroxyarylamine O-acetyltransferase
MLNHYVMSHADSPMLGRLVAARVAADRRFGLGNGVLSVHHLHGASERRPIGSAAELKGVLETTFGIDVPDVPDVEAALERVLRDGG